MIFAESRAAISEAKFNVNCDLEDKSVGQRICLIFTGEFIDEWTPVCALSKAYASRHAVFLLFARWNSAKFFAREKHFYTIINEPTVLSALRPCNLGNSDLAIFGTRFAKMEMKREIPCDLPTHPTTIILNPRQRYF